MSPHVLAEADAWFLILAGHLRFLTGNGWADAPGGAALFAPRGSVRAFKNTGDRPCRMLVHAAPSGIERFFDAADAVFPPSGPPGPDRVAARRLRDVTCRQ